MNELQAHHSMTP